jgi:hypothetical protein
MRPLISRALLIATLIAPTSFAAEPLPAHLIGKWDGRLTDGRSVYWTWTVDVIRHDPDGSLEAVVDVSGGINCFTRKRHTTGNFDGTKLVLTLPREPQARCPNLTLELERGTAHLFEGVGASTMRNVKMYLDRAK